MLVCPHCQSPVQVYRIRQFYGVSDVDPKTGRISLAEDFSGDLQDAETMGEGLRCPNCNAEFEYGDDVVDSSSDPVVKKLIPKERE